MRWLRQGGQALSNEPPRFLRRASASNPRPRRPLHRQAACRRSAADEPTRSPSSALDSPRSKKRCASSFHERSRPCVRVLTSTRRASRRRVSSPGSRTHALICRVVGGTAYPSRGAPRPPSPRVAHAGPAALLAESGWPIHRQRATLPRAPVSLKLPCSPRASCYRQGSNAARRLAPGTGIPCL